MGLAGPRNRTKISHDPRNTAWSSSTSRFGHRILTTLGWTPGSTLGDTTSPYHKSGHITAASQKGVKIILKDDNLGVGCNRRAREDECVGLDGLQDLLGRLNGKDEEAIGKETEARERMKKEVIVGERYGMRFVRGGTYVSSDIETLLKRIEGERMTKEERLESDRHVAVLLDKSSSVRVEKGKKRKKGKKAKRDKSPSKPPSATLTPSEGIDTEPTSKKRKRTDDDTEKAAKEKNDDKEISKMSKKSKTGETREERKARRELEKREKEARKAEEKRKRKSSNSDSSDSSDDEESTTPSGTVTPSISAALVGRQAVRHRYIAAKRSSVMDVKALNEIFMIKA